MQLATDLCLPMHLHLKEKGHSLLDLMAVLAAARVEGFQHDHPHRERVEQCRHHDPRIPHSPVIVRRCTVVELRAPGIEADGGTRVRTEPIAALRCSGERVDRYFGVAVCQRQLGNRERRLEILVVQDDAADGVAGRGSERLHIREHRVHLLQ